MKLMGRTISGLVASLALTATVSAQVTIGTIGNAANGTTYPLGFSGGYTKFQQVYASTLFAAPLTISDISFYSKPGTQILQQGTFNFYFNTTTTAPGTVNTGNPLANETVANRKFFGTFAIGANVDAPSILSFTGTNAFTYNPAMGNLVLDIDFAPIGNFINSGRAAFDQYFDAQGAPVLVATSSDPQALFLVTAGGYGRGLVTTFGSNGGATAVVPEPSTVVLLTAGLAGMGLVGYRRRSV